MAISCIQNAKLIYEAREFMQEFEKNIYGMALSFYTIGFIYQEFAQHLSLSESRFKNYCKEEHKHYMV